MPVILIYETKHFVMLLKPLLFQKFLPFAHVSVFHMFHAFLSGALLVITDSIPFTADNDQTQLPCSPSTLMSTDVAQKLLSNVEEKEAMIEVGWVHIRIIYTL